MASKNPKTPAPARAAKKTTSPAAPRRRTAKPAAPAVAAAAADVESAVLHQPLPAPVDSAEQVRIRAYFLHLERKGRPGNPVEDWLAAERELVSGASGRQS